MIRTLLLAGALVLGATGAANATIVNIDAANNAGLDGSLPSTNAIDVLLGAGAYSITPIDGQYTAFRRFSQDAGCDVNGENCSQGYEHSYRLLIDATTLAFGDGAANRGIGPISPGNGYFDTALHAFNQASPLLGAFTLAAQTHVKFFIYDDYLGDNSGGISLSVGAAGVPEPASWTLMIAGFGLAGAALRRRKPLIAQIRKRTAPREPPDPVHPNGTKLVRRRLHRRCRGDRRRQHFH